MNFIEQKLLHYNIIEYYAIVYLINDKIIFLILFFFAKTKTHQ